jgi:hypothetical protein
MISSGVCRLRFMVRVGRRFRAADSHSVWISFRGARHLYAHNSTPYAAFLSRRFHAAQARASSPGGSRRGSGASVAVPAVQAEGGFGGGMGVARLLGVLPEEDAPLARSRPF